MAKLHINAKYKNLIFIFLIFNYAMHEEMLVVIVSNFKAYLSEYEKASKVYLLIDDVHAYYEFLKEDTSKVSIIEVNEGPVNIHKLDFPNLECLRVYNQVNVSDMKLNELMITPSNINLIDYIKADNIYILEKGAVKLKWIINTILEIFIYYKGNLYLQIDEEDLNGIRYTPANTYQIKYEGLEKIITPINKKIISK